jgi:hypothetical protein
MAAIQKLRDGVTSSDMVSTQSLITFYLLKFITRKIYQTTIKRYPAPKGASVSCLLIAWVPYTNADLVF